ncbi:MAG: DUF3168 domain-containing protein [Fimbriimonadia bacterium]|nr:DUF3168 domain-containing protein [Fimbriimonadia bacterium]
MSETGAIEQSLYTALTSEAGITAVVGTRVYAYLAPQGAVMPYIVYAPVSGGIESNCTHEQQTVEPLYTVRAVSEGGSMLAVHALAELIHSAIGTTAESVVTGVQLLGCYRESTVEYVEVFEGKRYCHAGGVYRVLAYQI